MPRRGRRRLRPLTRLGLLLGICLAFPTACGSLFDTEPEVPGGATVALEGAAGTEVDLIVSNRFVRSTERSGVDLLAADTNRVTQPFSGDYPLSDPPRFFVRVENPSEIDVSVRMRVAFEGEERFDRSRLLEPADFLDFAFYFTSP